MIGTLTRLISYFSGKAAMVGLPEFLREPALRFYGRVYGVNFNEIEKELALYRSFSEFFSRTLIPGSRNISGPICSPADGSISGIGRVISQQMVQAKGKSYTLGELLLDGSLAAEFEGGSYFTVYLAPGDYHRVHSPVTGEIRSIRHIPGAMFPVSPAVASRRERLFSRNERVCLLIDSKEHGKVCVVFVGALNVGSISLNSVQLKTNHSFSEVFSPPPFSVEFLEQEVEIGEELGKFHLGSTVVVITERELELKLGIGDRVKMGQAVD